MVHTIEKDVCIGCGKCVQTCPLDVLRLVDGKAEIVYPDDCMTCYLCEHNCPVGAVFVHPFKEAPPLIFPGILDAKKGG